MNVLILWILYFDRINVSKVIEANKTSPSKKCDICHYWYFLNEGFKFQLNVCNRSWDLLIMSMNLCDIAILNTKGSVYCCVISGISTNEAINLMENAYLMEKSRTLKNIKMGKEFLTFGDIEIEKITFYHHISLVPLRDVDIEKVLRSNKVSSAEKNYK